MNKELIRSRRWFVATALATGFVSTTGVASADVWKNEIGTRLGISEKEVELSDLSTPEEIEEAVRVEARKYDIDENEFVRVMKCESKGDPKAKNRSGASGLFQFIPSTWRLVTRTILKRPDMDVFNPNHNIEAAATLWKIDGSHHWSECGG